MKLSVLVPAALLTILVAAGCSSKGTTAASPKKGGGVTTASAAKTSGQKVGTSARQNKAKAVAKGPSLGGTGKQKGGGVKTAVAAKTAGQKAMSTSKVMVDKAKAVDKGPSMPDTSGDVACDADHENEAFCADDTNASFCSGGHWYTLDCAAAEGGFCGEDVAANTIDCYGSNDLVNSDAVSCDSTDDSAAYCEDDDREVFCDQGQWYELSCASVAPGYWCGEEDDTHVVDCGQ